MKRRLSLILLLFLVISCFSACIPQGTPDGSVPDAGNAESKEESRIIYDMNYISEDGGVNKDWVCPENSLYRFLTENNFEGKLLPSEAEPSGEPILGGLPDADGVVQDERNIKNTDVTLSFSTKEPYVMYLLAFDESGKETLVLITYDGGISDNSLVLVCETDFGTAENFYSTVYGEKTFTAKVLADFNVTAFHARYLGVLRANEETDLLVTDGKEENPNKNKYYMGYFGNPRDYKFGNFMYSNLVPDESLPENDALKTVSRINELLELFNTGIIIE